MARPASRPCAGAHGIKALGELTFTEEDSHYGIWAFLKV